MTDKKPEQIDHEQFATLTDAEIIRARRLGQLDAITGVPAQLTRADLEAMTPEAITAASQRGALANLLGARPPKPNPGQRGNAQHGSVPLVQLDLADLKTMSPEAIVAARKAGELDNLIGTMPPRPSIHYNN